MNSVQLLVLAKFVDAVSSALAEGVPGSAALRWGGGFLACLAAERLLDVAARLLSTEFRLKVDAAFENLLLDKHEKIAYSVLAQEQSNELIQRVTEEASGKARAGFENLITILQYLIRILGVVVASATGSVWAAMSVFALFVVVLPLAKKCGEENYAAYAEASASFRRSKYDRMVLSQREYAHERTLFGYTEAVGKRWEGYERDGCVRTRAADWKNTIRSKLCSCGILLAYMVLSVLLMVQVGNGQVSVGLFVGILTGILQIVSMLTWNLSGYLEDYVENKCYLEDLRQFLGLPEAEQENAPEENPDLPRLEEVGSDLSGGQWQRLALARANRKPCSLLILDEPTAAIDALAETELYQTFRESCRGRIGLIVTHRLGVVQLCSKVLVLREGRLLDFGTHEELLRRCGYYKTLWQSQADMYREDK